MTTSAATVCEMLLSDTEILKSVQLAIGAFPVFTGENEVSADQIRESTEQAIATYNINNPRVLTHVVQGRGTISRFYRLTGFNRDGEPNALLGSTWDDNFSVMRSVRYPVPATEQLPTYQIDHGSFRLEPRELLRYSEYDTFERTASIEVAELDGPVLFPETWLVFQSEVVPDAMNSFLMEYTTPHKLIELGCTPPEGVDQKDHKHTTVPKKHKNALIYLTVALVAMNAAIRAEKALDKPSGAEFVSMRDKSRGFTRIADHYRTLYAREIGVDTVPAAATLVDVDISNVFSVTQRQGNVSARGLSGYRDSRGRF